jgi:hypothetical protein
LTAARSTNTQVPIGSNWRFRFTSPKFASFDPPAGGLAKSFAESLSFTMDDCEYPRVQSCLGAQPHNPRPRDRSLLLRAVVRLNQNSVGSLRVYRTSNPVTPVVVVPVLTVELSSLLRCRPFLLCQLIFLCSEALLDLPRQRCL